MSTTALIAFQNEDGTYDINCINFDGYIDGVGKKLQTYWDEAEKAKELCHAKEIRGLDSDFDLTEFYAGFLGVLKKRKNLSFNDLCNEAGNFSYTYVYEDDMWQQLSDREIVEPY